MNLISNKSDQRYTISHGRLHTTYTTENIINKVINVTTFLQINVIKSNIDTTISSQLTFKLPKYIEFAENIYIYIPIINKKHLCLNQYCLFEFGTSINNFQFRLFNMLIKFTQSIDIYI